MPGFTTQTDVYLFFGINTDKGFVTIFIRHSRQHQTLEQGLAADEKILGIEHRLIHNAAPKRDFFVKNGAQINERTRNNRDDQTAGK